MKFAAILLGPVGVGLVGIYSSLVQTATSAASLGIGQVGIRQIAAAKPEGGDLAVGQIRRAVFWGSMTLAIIGGALFWLSRSWIARVFLSDQTRAGDVGWLSIGVVLSVGVASQRALLTGLHRIGDLARISVGAGVLSTLLSLLALRLWPSHAVVLLVLITPALTFLFGRIYIFRLGPAAGPRPRISEIARELQKMAPLGFAFMISSLLLVLGQLITRIFVQWKLGADALGQFQAASTIGVTYLSFVLGAMGTDYFPRLAAVVGDRSLAARLINEQTEVALLLCAPVVLALLALSPWVVPLLYSPQFSPAVEVLRWQLVGDILKVISWPMAFLQQAKGASKVFLLTETAGQASYLALVFFGLPLFGLKATGIAYCILYAWYLPCMWWLSRRWINFHWTQAVRLQAIAVITAVGVVDLMSRRSDLMGAAVGIGCASLIALWALTRLSAVTEARGKLAKVGEKGEQIRSWITQRGRLK